MPTIHLHQTTTSTPEQVLAGITTSSRAVELFPNSADDQLEVHDKSPDHADVTEGGKGNWERLHYDWSDPNRVLMTTTDSNVWGNGTRSRPTRSRPSPTGPPTWTWSSYATARTSRDGFLGVVLATVGKGVLQKALDQTVKAIEARNYAAGAAQPT